MKTFVDLARSLGGTIHGRWINVRGPNHSKNDHSLGIMFDPNAPDGFYVNSLAGDDPVQCRAHVRALLDEPRGDFQTSSQPAHSDSEDDMARRAHALSLWRDSKPAQETIVETYLLGRRCEARGALESGVIRFHPYCPFGYLRVRAMVTLITDAITGEPIGVHRTAIKDDGSGKRKFKDGMSSKRMLGVARNGAIRLYPACEHLGIAEGVETALSASRLFGGIAVWATTSSGGIATFPILQRVRRLTVFADYDAAGLKAAEKCCRRYQSVGIDAELRHPPIKGTDWNDFVMKETD